MIEMILMALTIAFFTSPVGMIVLIICFNLPSSKKKRKYNQTHPWDSKSKTMLPRKYHEKAVRQDKRNYYKNKIFGMFK